MKLPDTPARSTEKRKISDFFTKKAEKRPKEQQNTIADVQSLKCPRKKILTDETNGIIVGISESEDAEVKRRSGRIKIKKLGKSQMILDCGQNVFGAITCPKCNMIYSADAAEDVKAHQKFHRDTFRMEIPKSFINLFEFESKMFLEKDQGKYKVFYLNPKFADDAFRRLINKHFEIINRDLGYTPSEDDDLWDTEKRRIFLCMMTVDKKMYIGGIAVVEKVWKAWTDLTRTVRIALRSRLVGDPDKTEEEAPPIASMRHEFCFCGFVRVDVKNWEN
uniref:Zf-C2H2_3 domain-containing protein n=1 Tax=Caenorhabditis japonica TaxID=281687 RepID=A0A8R1HXS1_CAEJA